VISEREYGEFLDLAYGAALEPGSWTQVIERFADLMGGAKAWMPALNLRDGSGDGILARIDPREQDAYFEYYATVNPFFLAETIPANDPWPLTITTDEDLFLKEEFVRTEYYNDFLRPQEIHSAAIVRLTRQNGVETTLNLGRPERRGQFEAEDLRVGALLQPHVVRSLAVGRSLAAQGQFTGDLVEVLDRAAHGLFLLDVAGQLRHANREAERLLALRDGLRVTGGRLSAAGGDSGQRLDALICRAGAREPHARSGGSMLMTTPLGGASLSLTVAPLSSERAPAPFGPWVLVCVTDLAANVRLPEQTLRDLFALTAAEARVALALFEGASPQGAAEGLGVSIATVRNQIASIFEKTQTHRQVDLVRLMMRVLGVGGL
jgi:DNA-binding CsgD family transcriptional regulator